MLLIREALTLPALKEFRLLCGESGLDNTISTVTMLDYETAKKDFSEFQKDDFILTSLFFAKDDPSLINDAFKALFKRGISGAAIKTIFYNDVPDEVKRIANALNIPIFTYQTTYMEDIILAINTYKLEKDQLSFTVRRLDMLLSCERTTYAVTETARAIDAMLYQNCLACFAAPNDGFLPSTAYHTQTLRNSGAYLLLIPYRRGIMALYSFPSIINEADAQNVLLKCFADIGVCTDNWRFGYSRPCSSYENYDMMIRQAFFAYMICKAKNVTALSFANAGVYRFLSALPDDKSVMDECARSKDILHAHYAENGIDLLGTLEAYAAAHGNYDETGKLVFQHPNTVRNRIKKIKQLLNLDDNSYEQLFIIASLLMLDKVRRECL